MLHVIYVYVYVYVYICVRENRESLEPSSSKRKGNNLKGVKGLKLKATARIWS